MCFRKVTKIEKCDFLIKIQSKYIELDVNAFKQDVFCTNSIPNMLLCLVKPVSIFIF